jgi:hypothetical protein
LDRTQWRLSQAIDHVATQIERAVVRGELAQLCDPTAPPWRRAENPRQTAASNAAREILVALQDGDLHAQGRLSTTRCGSWTKELHSWDLHSGHHSTITPEQWRAGRAFAARKASRLLCWFRRAARASRSVIVVSVLAAGHPLRVRDHSRCIGGLAKLILRS